jgi:YesN/AraC family two-component response regulator
MDYLLKPITADELSESLKRIRERLDKQLAERRDLSLLRDYYEQSLPQLRSGFLTQLINGNLQPRQIEESIRTLKITECIRKLRKEMKKTGNTTTINSKAAP